MDNMQKDLVLAINEYAFVSDKTKGHISCWVGPCKTSLSTSDELVKFNKEIKKFLPVQKYNDAIQLFTTAPENWYIALKNPAADGRHPNAGGANTNPEKIKIGCKVNIPGPCTFALYPGQMAQVIKGHTLRSNQYLLARVYDADALNNMPEKTKSCDSCNGCADEDITQKCEECKTKDVPYVNGQILVIKGTEVSFYIPPTGIEVIPIDNNEQNGYIRDAVTLERLEYCILKDEDGNKRYVHGPEVVFPEPTETFVTSNKGSYIFRAMELSKISGIYVKVIAEYEDKNGLHPVGEELFITGEDQMIYYPRPEHAIISYDNKIMHHAIAIPAGEGRYIMDRLTGDIRTVKGPAMYLPDPRTEVVVKRKLTDKQCHLWFPGNREVLAYNSALNEKAVEKSTRTSTANNLDYQTAFATCNSLDATLANLEAKANISRGTSYAKPRTITLDNKLDGVVSLDIWTGYAVNVVSKSGDRKVICGPKTVLLDYDQTLETLHLSTGKPKTTDALEETVFLRYENNRVSDIIEVETADFVKAQIKVSYLVNFDEKYKSKWFSIDNYVKHLCDWGRVKVKEYVRGITIDALCEDYHQVVEIALNQAVDSNKEVVTALHTFKENGMVLEAVEALNLAIQADVQLMMDKHQAKIIERTLELNATKQSTAVEKQLAELTAEKIKLKNDLETLKMQKSAELEKEKFMLQVEAAKAVNAEEKRKEEAEVEIQKLKDELFNAEQARTKASRDADLAYQKERDTLSIAKEKASAAAMVDVLTAIGPDLAAAMTSDQNEAMVRAIATAVSPYAVARGESVAEAVNTLLRGSSLEEIVNSIRKARD